MDSQYPPSADQTFRWELYILGVTGFVPFPLVSGNHFSPKLTNVIDKCSRVIGILLIIGSWLCSLALCHLMSMRLGRTDWYFPTNNPIIQAAVASSVCTVNIRAAVVLTIMAVKRDAWYGIIAQFHRLAKTVKRSPSVKVFGGLCCILLVVTTALWPYSFLAIVVGIQIPFAAVETFDPLPVTFHLYEFVILWFVFCIFPVFLNQLLLGTLMTFALFQYRCLETILAWQSQTLSKLRNENHEDTLPMNGDEVDVGKIHYETVALCDRLNGSFSRALFFIYGLDCLTAFGNVATLVAGFAHTEHKLSPWFIRMPVIYAILVFLSHATLCLIPMALVEQTGQQIADGYYKLWSVIQLNGMGNLDSPLLKDRRPGGDDFKRLGMISEKSVPAFYAGHVCRITWHFITKTLTYMASFVILAYEIVDVSGVRDGLEKLQETIHSQYKNLTTYPFNYSA